MDTGKYDKDSFKGAKMPDDHEQIEIRVAAVKQLLVLFRWERATYLIVNGLALAMLLAAGGALLLRQNADMAILTALFGSSGLITFTIGRLLRMWDQAFALIQQAATKQGGA